MISKHYFILLDLLLELFKEYLYVGLMFIRKIEARINKQIKNITMFAKMNTHLYKKHVAEIRQKVRNIKEI